MYRKMTINRYNSPSERSLMSHQMPASASLYTTVVAKAINGILKRLVQVAASWITMEMDGRIYCLSKEGPGETK